MDFYTQVEDIFAKLDAFAEELDPDEWDVNSGDGSITLVHNSGRQWIISRHQPTQQIWLATPQKGLHFECNEQGEWRCNRSGELLMTIIENAIKHPESIE